MTDTPADISPRTFRFSLAAILAAGILLRGLFPAADPPWNPTVGVIWHDEGAWVHNARNKALFGAWSQDKWNPVYIAPVFTGLEYLSFAAFGVGVRQARLVPEACGLLSVLLLGLGVARIAGRRAGLFAAALLATNFFYVMWNRAALMEGPMAAFIVAAWYCYTRAEKTAQWGFAAGGFALCAFFTKASSAFFVAALGLDALITIATARMRSIASEDRHVRAAWWTLAGLAGCGAVALAVFVLPNWADYRFYNWQTSVVRKPAYTLESLIDRATWFPLQDAFTRMWFVLALGMCSALGMLARWRTLSDGERLLLWWCALGAAEVVLHDAGNERRFVFFVPVFVALAALSLGRGRILPAAAADLPRRRALLALPLVLYGAYVLSAAIVRVAFLRQISPNVRLGTAIALVCTGLVYATWPRVPRALARGRWMPAGSLAIVSLLVAGDLVQYTQWASGRTYKNYAASVQLGQRLPAGTLVHGKLANGLALENRIRPVFIGRGFGNYDDRKTRDDVRYILTYVAPGIGYESQAHNPVIQDVIDAYPSHSIIMTFDVAETATGHDRAALIDKFGGGAGRESQLNGRAKH